MTIQKKIFIKGKKIKYIRCGNAGENKSPEKRCIESGLEIGLKIEEAQKSYCECANTLIKIENMLIKTNANECASDKLEGRMPNYSHFPRTFGEMAVVKDRGIHAIFIGYAENYAEIVYTFINMKTKKIILRETRETVLISRILCFQS